MLCGDEEKGETEACLTNMKKGKILSIDGLPVKCYCTFWELLGDWMHQVRVCLEVLEGNRLPESMRCHIRKDVRWI